MSATFHALRVAAIDELTDDAVALTFDVPAGAGRRLRLHARSAPQHPRRRRRTPLLLDLHRAVLRAGSGSGSSGCPGGAFSEGVLGSLRVGDTLDVMTPAGRFTTAIDPAAARRCVVVAAGSGHHAGPVDRHRDPGGRAGVVGHAGLRQPDAPDGDVPRRGARPQGPLPVPAADRARAVARGLRRRAAVRAARRRPADRASCRRSSRPGRRRLVPLRSAADARRPARRGLARLGVPPPACTASSSTPTRSRAPRSPRSPAAPTAPRRSPSAWTAAPRRSTCAPTTYPCSTPRSGSAPTCPSPARAASAAPAARASSPAPSRWTPTTRSSPTRSTRGYVLTCQAHPTSDEVVLDYDG